MTGTLTRGLLRIVAADAHEGPTYFPDEDALYVTTTRGPAGTSILRIALDGLRPVGPDAVTVLRTDTHVANGMTADADGRLVVCEQGTVPCLVEDLVAGPELVRQEPSVHGQDGVQGWPILLQGHLLGQDPQL